MPRQVFFFDPPERFVAGTVGQPGQRTFFLQASGAGRVVSVALEKVQVSVLAERLEELLEDLRRRGADVPPAPPRGTEDLAPLEMPIMEEFRVGTMQLAWDAEDGRLVIEAWAQEPAGEGGGEEPEDAPGDADDAEGPDILRVRITAGAGLAFVRRALRLVAAGRPPCPLCSLPLDPEGHLCPRLNGHRR